MKELSEKDAAIEQEIIAKLKIAENEIHSQNLANELSNAHGEHHNRIAQRLQEQRISQALQCENPDVSEDKIIIPAPVPAPAHVAEEVVSVPAPIQHQSSVKHTLTSWAGDDDDVEGDNDELIEQAQQAIDTVSKSSSDNKESDDEDDTGDG